MSFCLGTLAPREAEIFQQLEEQGLSVQPYFPCRKPPLKRTVASKANVKSKSKHTMVEEELFVVLYGARKQFRAVGDYLQDCELYLQDPINTDLNLPYLNPHTMWAHDSNAHVRMTVENAADYNPGFEEFTSAFDILKDLEYEGYLAQSPTPSPLKTTLFA
jgi:hypothetical protein